MRNTHFSKSAVELIFLQFRAEMKISQRKNSKDKARLQNVSRKAIMDATSRRRVGTTSATTTTTSSSNGNMIDEDILFKSLFGGGK